MLLSQIFKKRFLNVISKQRHFSGNVDIFEYMEKMQFFHRVLKKITFSLNYDIFGDMAKKIFKSYVRITSFLWKC